MWIVKLALRRPYTIAVMAILLVVMGVLSASRMVVDIFPAIDIPVVAVVWNYPGLSAEDMERRVVIISERAYSSTVDGISRIESQSIPGIGLLKIYFQPDADIGGAIAQISSVSSTILTRCSPRLSRPSSISRCSPPRPTPRTSAGKPSACKPWQPLAWCRRRMWKPRRAEPTWPRCKPSRCANRTPIERCARRFRES